MREEGVDGGGDDCPLEDDDPYSRNSKRTRKVSLCHEQEDPVTNKASYPSSRKLASKSVLRGDRMIEDENHMEDKEEAIDNQSTGTDLRAMIGIEPIPRAPELFRLTNGCRNSTRGIDKTTACVLGTVYNVEYEGFNMIYFDYGRIGHKKDQCIRLLKSLRLARNLVALARRCRKIPWVPYPPRTNEDRHDTGKGESKEDPRPIEEVMTFKARGQTIKVGSSKPRNEKSIKMVRESRIVQISSAYASSSNPIQPNLSIWSARPSMRRE
ncbi:hypothetical protein CRG98_023089 [Punica granatum]|uniref:Uncharacterized protein n=1 Tax=Punica granatum TaxID=22663 RepID=A0A2I0JKT6_PUNGR|nr:hypothetical protein CRG98_023089 [Punica granatum]